MDTAACALRIPHEWNANPPPSKEKTLKPRRPETLNTILPKPPKNASRRGTAKLLRAAVTVSGWPRPNSKRLKEKDCGFGLKRNRLGVEDSIIQVGAHRVRVCLPLAL